MYIQCPDEVLVKSEECLRGCRQSRRCASMVLINRMLDKRRWTGKPSCTMLIGGLREAYLSHVYREKMIIEPDKELFAILGTMGHAALGEGYELGETELEGLEWEGISGMPDHVYKEGNDVVIDDFKFYGSYKAMQAVGVESFEKPMIRNGEVVRYKTGKDASGRSRVGMVRMEKVYELNSEKADVTNETLQLNLYRMALSASRGIEATKLNLEIFVRDGNTQAAQERGIRKNHYYIPIGFLPENTLKDFFLPRRDLLTKAIELNREPPVCGPEERWGDDRKCRDYCRVAHVCSYGCMYGRKLDGVA